MKGGKGMKQIDAQGMEFEALNRLVRQTDGDVEICSCLGQRFIGAGLSEKNIVIHGVPGNALGAYLDGAEITVYGNVQDAVGDTMNDGSITVYGGAGDAVGYAMRGGQIYIKGDVGYRAGIHMKAYREKQPIMIIGGKAGSFLGEYQAGGTIVVLGLTERTGSIVGNFPCTGMHGGKMFLRSDCRDVCFPQQVHAVHATKEDMALIEDEVRSFCRCFGYAAKKVLDAPFTVVTPDSKNPYKQMYVAN